MIMKLLKLETLVNFNKVDAETEINAYKSSADIVFPEDVANEFELLREWIMKNESNIDKCISEFKELPAIKVYLYDPEDKNDIQDLYKYEFEFKFNCLTYMDILKSINHFVSLACAKYFTEHVFDDSNEKIDYKDMKEFINSFSYVKTDSHNKDCDDNIDTNRVSMDEFLRRLLCF